MADQINAASPTPAPVAGETPAQVPGWTTRIEQINPNDHPVFGPILKAVQGAVEHYQPATPNRDYTHESKPDWMHEQANSDHWWNQPFAHFREGLDRMTEDLHDYADSHSHVLTPAATMMLHGIAAALGSTDFQQAAPPHAEESR